MDLEEIRAFCLSFPGATEDVKWEHDLTFCVAGKMFAVSGFEAATPKGISFKCTPEKFSELVEIEGIRPADYVARYHWVTIENMNALRKDELEALIGKSYAMVRDKLPKKVRQELGG